MSVIMDIALPLPAIFSSPHLTLFNYLPACLKMDGLLKGVKDLALGLLDKDDDTPSRDERSRSSWAEVVSGEQDNEDQQSANHRQGHGRPNQNQWERKGEGRNAEWETEGSRPSSRQPQKVEHEGYRRDEGDEQRQGYNQKNHSDIKENAESNDGWETVGKKKQPRHKVQKDQWSGYKKNPNEQPYSDEVEIGASLEPSREELGDLTKACQKLWELDLNRLVPGKDYQIDCGEGKKVYQKGDMAQGTLFSWLGDDVLSKPTFARFCSLLDNYNPNQGYKEVVTPEERQEQAAFIEEISRTAPIKYVHNYLSANGVLPENYNDFKRALTSLWFDLYNRGGAHGSSSAFEHVFVGEIKQRGEQEVSGFHNWLQFYLEEAKGAVDYQGYIFPRRRGEVPDSETQLLTLQFEWNGVLKSVSSTLVGVSPEFEVALYTLCFYMGGEDNHLELGPYYINIKCYRLGDKIGSVFPIAEN